MQQQEILLVADSNVGLVAGVTIYVIHTRVSILSLSNNDQEARQGQRTSPLTRLLNS